MVICGPWGCSGYNKHGKPGEPLKDITPTRDILEAGGFYDESPRVRPPP